MAETVVTVVDATGKACPMPILELARALRSLEIGQALDLLASDPATEADLRAFCERTGHALVSLSSDARILRARVRKSA